MISYNWPSSKYSSARDAYLHAMCQEGWANTSTGDVESPVGYIYRVSNTAEEIAEIVDAFGRWPELETGECTIQGHFLVTENSQGFVYVDRYDTEFLLINAYTALENEYDRWCDTKYGCDGPEILADSDEISVTGI